MVLVLGLALFLAEADVRPAPDPDLCAEILESSAAELDLEVLEEWDPGDCAPAELLPDVSCEDAPSTFWPAAVTACNTPLVKARRGAPHRAPRLQQSVPGRRPLKGVAASDDGSFRGCGGPHAPLPTQPDTAFVRDPALIVLPELSGPAAQRLQFPRGDAARLAAGHSRRLERPPEA
jgi:hypothetical protein